MNQEDDICEVNRWLLVIHTGGKYGGANDSSLDLEIREASSNSSSTHYIHVRANTIMKGMFALLLPQLSANCRTKWDL